MRQFCMVVGAAGVAMAALAGTAANAQTKIRIGTAPSYAQLPVFVGQEKGFCARRGVEIEPTLLANGAMIPPALLSGSIDLGFGTPTNFLLANDGGLDFVVTTPVARDVRSSPLTSLLRRPDLDIRSPADWKGKTIAVPGISSVMDVLLRTWLRKNGVGPSDVRIVEMPQPKMSPGLQSKSLDGVVVLEPFRTQILSSKHGVKASDYTADIADDVLFGFMMGTRAFVEAHPEAIRALNACWAEAQDFMVANPDETREIERRHYHFAENNPPQLGRSVSPADFKFYADLMQAQGLLRKPVDPSKLVFEQGR